MDTGTKSNTTKPACMINQYAIKKLRLPHKFVIDKSSHVAITVPDNDSTTVWFDIYQKEGNDFDLIGYLSLDLPTETIRIRNVKRFLTINELQFLLRYAAMILRAAGANTKETMFILGTQMSVRFTRILNTPGAKRFKITKN